MIDRNKKLYLVINCFVDEPAKINVTSFNELLIDIIDCTPCSGKYSWEQVQKYRANIQKWDNIYQALETDGKLGRDWVSNCF
jgi:hypothetical protein